MDLMDLAGMTMEELQAVSDDMDAKRADLFSRIETADEEECYRLQREFQEAGMAGMAARIEIRRRESRDVKTRG